MTFCTCKKNCATLNNFACGPLSAILQPAIKWDNVTQNAKWLSCLCEKSRTQRAGDSISDVDREAQVISRRQEQEEENNLFFERRRKNMEEMKEGLRLLEEGELSD